MSAPRSKRDGGFGLQTERLARPANRSRLEVGALECDQLRLVGDFRPTAAHYAGYRLRLLRVGDHQHLAIQCSIDTVERGDRFPFGRAADAQCVLAELVEIERVHRVAEFHQHVVGDVDERADRPDARRPAAATSSKPACWCVADTVATAAA